MVLKAVCVRSKKKVTIDKVVGLYRYARGGVQIVGTSKSCPDKIYTFISIVEGEKLAKSLKMKIVKKAPKKKPAKKKKKTTKKKPVKKKSVKRKTTKKKPAKKKATKKKKSKR